MTDKVLRLRFLYNFSDDPTILFPFSRQIIQKLHLFEHSSIRSHLNAHGDLLDPIPDILIDNTNIIPSSTCKTKAKINGSLINKKQKGHTS